MRIFVFILMSVFVLSGCATQYKRDLSVLNIGMSKEEVVRLIGTPDQAIGAKRYNDDIVEISEYAVMNNAVYSNDYGIKAYWFFFLNGQLDEWGPKENYTMDIEHYYDQIYYNLNHR